MNNERQGENCVHTWFLKQKEIKSQPSQWVSLSKDSSGEAAHLECLSLPFAHPWQWKKTPLPNQKALFLLVFPITFLFVTLRKIYFLEKKYLFQKKKNLFQKNKYLPLFCICSPFSLSSPRSLLHPPFSATLLLQPPFSSLSSMSLDGLRDPPPESSSACQSPTAASKNEVDSLRLLRMWHVARWDSDA